MNQSCVSSGGSELDRMYSGWITSPLLSKFGGSYPQGFQRFDHSPYSPDLAPSDYHLFPGLKNQLKGRHFLSDAEVISAANLVGRTTF